MSARNDQGEGSVMRDEIKNPCKELWYENRIEELEAENAELKIKLLEAAKHLDWFISEDETNRGDYPMPEHRNRTWDEINEYWIKHLDSAIAFVAKVKGDKK